MAQSAYGSTGWWMYHGDPQHTGFVSDSPINASNAGKLKVWKELQLGGPVLSTPAIVDGFVYVGIANAQGAVGSNGGAFYKIELATGAIAATFHWDIPASEGDAHGFCGMGSHPGRDRWESLFRRLQRASSTASIRSRSRRYGSPTCVTPIPFTTNRSPTS